MAKQNWKAKGDVPRRKTSRSRTTATAGSNRILSAAAVASLLVLALLIAAFVWVVQYLDPVTPARLFVLTGGNAVPGLPVNATAFTDARVLTQQAVLSDTQTPAAPPGRQEMIAGIRGILNHLPRTLTFLPWRDTTTIVYVNATGVVLPSAGSGTPSAWLVPADLDRTKSAGSQLIKLRDVIDATVSSAADRKLLVLDCQTAETNALFADTASQFVTVATQELNDIPAAEIDGLFVLFSCSPDEMAWRWPSRTESIFGHFFSSGIAGNADADGNQDERVTLDELVTYVTGNVRREARLRCAARQTPQLFKFGQATDHVTLVATGNTPGFKRPVAPPQASTRSSVLAALQRNWRRYHEFALVRPQPFELAPALWKRIQDELLLAESQLRGNDLDAAATTITRVEGGFQSVVELHQRMFELTSPASLTMLSAHESDVMNWPDASSKQQSAPSDAVLALIEDKLQPADALIQFAESATTSSAAIDVDQHLFRLMRSRPQVSPEALTDAEISLLELRRQAERASLPGHPGVSPWLIPMLQTADTARRRQEDAHLTTGTVRLRVGRDAEPAAGNAAELYANITQTQQTLNRAFRLRDQLLSELPFWVTFLRKSAVVVADSGSPRPTPGSSEGGEDQLPDGDTALPAGTATTSDFLGLVSQTLPGLVSDTRNLCGMLLQDPKQLDETRRIAEVGRIRQTATALAATRDRLLEELAAYSTDLDDERLWPATGTRWRRLDNLLTLPFACQAVDVPADEYAIESAELRLSLLEKCFAPAADTDRAVTETDDIAETEQPDSAVPAPRQLSVMSAEIATIPLANLTVPSAETTPTEWYAWREARQRDLRDMMVNSESLTWSDVLRADVAHRILPDADHMNDILSPTMSLHSRAYAGHLLNQAIRTTSDLYASMDEHVEHYYEVVAEKYRSSALKLQDSRRFLENISGNRSEAEPDRTTTSDMAFNEQLRVLDDRLQTYERALKEGRIAATPEQLLYRATSTSSLQLRLTQSDALPDGMAGIHVTPADRIAASQANTGNTAAEFRVIRPASAESAGEPIEALATFRGHILTGSVRDVIVDELEGTSFVYREQNTGNARLFVQPKQLTERPLQLVFVLDCSKSMGFEDETGTPRIRSLSKILAQFANFAEAGGLEVGIRLFGHRVADIEDPAAHTDTERVLRVALFAESRLNRILPIQPTGHSPIFNALLQARDDFPETEQDVRREVILISDGADNWAMAGQPPGIAELQAAYAGVPIRIHTIGYNVTRFADREQLQAIAAAAGGRAVTVTNAAQLFEELVGLAGLPGFRVIQNEETIYQQDRLDIAPAPVGLSPGNYSVEIVGAGNDIIARKAIRVLEGEDHRLVFNAGLVSYASDPRVNALAVVGGDDEAPQLVVTQAQRVQSGLDLEFGILPPANGSDVVLPVTASIVPDGRSGEIWRLQHVPPNRNSHYPAWKIRLENWPGDSQRFSLAVEWNESVEKSVAVTLNWDSPHKEIEVAPGIRLVRQTREIDPDGDGPTQVTLTFIFDHPGPEVRQWNVVPRSPIASVRHVYQSEFGLYTAQISLDNGSVPDIVDLIQLHRDPAAEALTAEVPLGNQPINR